MQRYFFDIYNSFVSIDDEGVELPDYRAALEQVRQTLPALLKDLQTGHDAAQMRVDVRDEVGRRVATGTILMVIEGVRERAEVEKGKARARVAPQR